MDILPELDAERAVLSAMLTGPQSVSEAIELLDAGCFRHVSHTIVFRALIECFDAEGDTDTAQVAEIACRLWKETDCAYAVDFSDLVGDLVADVVSPDTVAANAPIVAVQRCSPRLGGGS